MGKLVKVARLRTESYVGSSPTRGTNHLKKDLGNMHVKIGPYKSFFGPHQLAEVLCFWAKSQKNSYGIYEKPDWVHDFGEWLAHGSIEPDPEPGEIRSFGRNRHTTILYRFLHWLDGFRERKIYVRIDPYDVWNMDSTLAYIVLPMLEKLRDSKHGSPYVQDEDVPEHLRSTAAPPKENDYDIDDNHHLRWEWVLNEMIFAFRTKAGDLQDWEDQFCEGKHDFQFKKLEGGYSELIKGPNDTFKIDWDGRKKYQERIDNGFRLFGKYYSSLWD